MTDEANKPSTDDAIAWANDCMHQALAEVTETGIFQGLTVESKVAWALPNKIMIGRVRDTGGDHREFWLIAGELPTDCIDASTCPTARDAARHFALKWQLGAKQLLDLNARDDVEQKPGQDLEKAGNELAGIAEELYAIANEDLAWADSV